MFSLMAPSQRTSIDCSIAIYLPIRHGKPVPGRLVVNKNGSNTINYPSLDGLCVTWSPTTTSTNVCLVATPPGVESSIFVDIRTLGNTLAAPQRVVNPQGNITLTWPEIDLAVTHVAWTTTFSSSMSGAGSQATVGGEVEGPAEVNGGGWAVAVRVRVGQWVGLALLLYFVYFVYLMVITTSEGAADECTCE